MKLLDDIRQSVIDGNMEVTQQLVKAALEQNLPPEQILKEGLISAMAEVGRRFECNEYFVPEMLVSARAMKSSLGLLRPQLIEAHVQAIGKVVIGTVQGDLHDIGKNLVGMMLEGAGFEVIDLGTDVTAARYIVAIKDNHPDIIACSALITTTMPRMAEVIEAIEEAGLRRQVKVMVGGAPVNDKYASEIGADGYAPDAASAATRAKQLIAE